MKVSAKSTKTFDPHPEYSGSGVCVDVTPLKSVPSDYGPREVFRVVFETSVLRDDGKPFVVYSRSFTPSVHEKAALRGFLKQWLGRDLTAAELEELDTETFIGRPANLVIVHNPGKNGEVFANIGLIRPDKSGQPLKPSGKYIRQKDRDKQGKDANYQRVEQPDGAQPAADDWHFVKVHVGKHQGVELCELDRESVKALCENWLPKARQMEKPLKADRDLMAALERASADINPNPPVDDDLPY